jgi:uncharacterized protein
MLGLPSLGKILVIAAILLAVWFGFRLIGRLDRERRQALKEAGEARSSMRRGAGGRRSVSDLTECRSCHAFVAPAATCSECGAALKV